MTDWQRHFYAYARFALYDALRLSGVSHGDTVLLPAFICRDVLAPLNELGARPWFYGVDRLLQPVVPDGVPVARAILAVNYFGFPQRLTELRELALRTGAVIIEDNAHGYLSRDDGGAELGRRTGIGFTSFRKTLRVLNGAYLDVDMTLFPDVHGLVAEPPTDCKLPIGFRARRLAAAIEGATGAPVLNASRAIVRSARRLTRKPGIPASPESETVMPIERRVHSTALDALRRLDNNREAERRRSLYGEVAARLVACGHPPIFDEPGRDTVPWCVPFRATPDDVSAAQRALRGTGLEIFAWPDLPDMVRQDCPSWYSQVQVVSMLK